MSTRKILMGSLIVLSCIGLSLSIVFVASAAPAAMGDLNSPTAITSLPFSETVDVTYVSVGPNDPMPSCNYNGRNMTGWYAFTPETNRLVRATATFGYFDVMSSLVVFTVDDANALTEIACTSIWYSSGNLQLDLSAHQTYYFMLSGWASSAAYVPPSGSTMRFDLIELVPAENDAFANAEVITTLPFTASPDISQATIEPLEQLPSCWQSSGGSVWYAYTATTPDSLTVNPRGAVAVYTGVSLDSLSEVACGPVASGSFTLKTQVNTTYFFRSSDYDWYAGTGFTLYLTPPPQAAVGYYPNDPSIYDSINFYCDCWDPGNVEIQSILWDFGDGTTTEGRWVNHTYTADGDFTVNITASTADGRSATASRVVLVRTHDVGIASFNVPEQVKAGQKHRFVVSVANTHYPETVKVELYKHTPSGFTLFAALVQDVRVGKPTEFNFDYTFSLKDETDKVDTFQAIATVIGSRDVVWENNEMTIGPDQALRDWTVSSGVWGVINGQLTSTSDWSDSWIWAGDPPLITQGDMIASMTLKLSNSMGYWPGRHGGIMFFASVPTFRGDPNMNGYTIDWIDGYMEGTRLTRWDHGQPMTLYTTGVMDMPNPPLQWLVKVQGEWIRFYGDGVLLFEVQDNTYRSGYFGFWAYSNLTSIELSNVQIGKNFRSLVMK